MNIKLINTVEALLFGAGRPLRISEIRSLLELEGLVAELSDIKKCLNELEMRYIESSLIYKMLALKSKFYIVKCKIIAYSMCVSNLI